MVLVKLREVGAHTRLIWCLSYLAGFTGILVPGGGLEPPRGGGGGC